MPSNLPIIKEMFGDRQYREFTFEVDALLAKDPSYTPKQGRKIFEGTARGERIVRLDDQYVISSFVPPVPSEAFKTFISAGTDENTLFKDLGYVRRLAPLTAHLCITPRCMYRCKHCGATIADKHAEPTTDQWKKVIAGLQEMGVAYIVFSGGEPLLRADMEEIIGSVDDRSTTLLFTNGKELSAERAFSLKQSGLFILAVSLDSADAEKHNAVRRHPEAFSHALEAIENASRAGLYTLVSSVVFRRDLNRENLHRLFALARCHGAHEVRIHQPIPRGKLAHAEEAREIFHTKEDTARLSRIQFAANRHRNGFPKVSSFSYTEGPHKFGCGAGILHSYITSTGDLWPCDFVPLSFGNVFTEGLKRPYERMMKAAGVPKRYCMAKHIAGQLEGRELPLGIEESTELCRRCQSKSYPRFFHDLQVS